jgi:hypothetical protein
MRSQRASLGRIAVRAVSLVAAIISISIATLGRSPSLVAAENDKPATDVSKEGEASASKTASAKTTDKSATDENRTNPADPKTPLKRLLPEYDVWIDVKNKHVVIDGEVCLTRGLLEMFACLRGSKEHESVVSVNTKAYVVHAALLAMRAKEGSPAKWEPKYQPATGTEIDIMIFWTDDKGQPQKAKAQDWVRDIKTQKPLTFPWVFAGSRFHKEEMTGKQHYLADASGDFICVSNFPSALLDLPVESSQANADLAFEAFTENIPPRGTKVQLVLMPKLEKKGDDKVPPQDAKSKKTD